MVSCRYGVPLKKKDKMHSSESPEQSSILDSLCLSESLVNASLMSSTPLDLDPQDCHAVGGNSCSSIPPNCHHTPTLAEQCQVTCNYLVMRCCSYPQREFSDACPVMVTFTRLPCTHLRFKTCPLTGKESGLMTLCAVCGSRSRWPDQSDDCSILV